MTPRFVFRPAARAELLEARDWYESQRFGLGAELAASTDAALTRIGVHPELYPEVRPGLRRAVSPRAELRPASHRQIAFNSRFCRGSARQESLFR